jgi:protein-disulfide isomerase
MLYPVLKKLKGEFGSRMAFVFHHLPLSSIHKNAQMAAQAAEAAKLQGKFWEMHDALYGGQSLWSELDDIRPVVTDYARQLGLNVEQFKKDLESPRVKAAVFADAQRAAALKIDSTPTVMIDGQLISNDNLSLDKMRQDLKQRLGLTH